MRTLPGPGTSDIRRKLASVTRAPMLHQREGRRGVWFAHRRAMRKALGALVVLVVAVGCNPFPCSTLERDVSTYTPCRNRLDPAFETGVPFAIHLSPSSAGSCVTNVQQDAGIIELVVLETRYQNCGWGGATAGAPIAPREPICSVPGLPAGNYNVTLSGETYAITIPSSGPDGGIALCSQ